MIRRIEDGVPPSPDLFLPAWARRQADKRLRAKVDSVLDELDARHIDADWTELDRQRLASVVAIVGEREALRVLLASMDSARWGLDNPLEGLAEVAAALEDGGRHGRRYAVLYGMAERVEALGGAA